MLLASDCVPKGEEEVTRIQGKLLRTMLGSAMQRGEIRSLEPELAASHFTGVMLNVPRLINEGQLRGRAFDYVEEVANAVWRVLAP